MAAPMAPTVKSPLNGDVNVDPLSALVLEKGAFSDPDVGTWLTEQKPATTDHGGDWTDPAYMRTGDGTQAQMATASAAGKAQLLSWSTVDFSAPSTALVKNVRLRIAAQATWPNPPDVPGLSSVYLVLMWKKKRLALNYFLGPDKWVGGTTPIPASSKAEFSIDYLLRSDDVLGQDYTIASLEGLGTDLQVYVTSVKSPTGFASTWKVGPVSLVADYYVTSPSRQSAFQILVSTASDFSTTVFDTGKLLERYTNRAVAPAGKLSFGKKHYAKARQWDDGDLASPYGASVSFDTLGEGGARLVHDQSAKVVTLVELETRRYLESAGWTKTAGQTSVYQYALKRSSEPSRNFFIVDFEEEGDRVGSVAKESVADVNATANSHYWDEDGGIMYRRSVDSRNPAGFRGLGVAVALAFPMADAEIVSGPGNKYNYEPRVKGGLEVTERLSDFREGLRATVSGSLELANHDALFDKLLVTGADPNWPDDLEKGWIANACRVRIRAGGWHSGGQVPYAETLPIADAVVEWDPTSLRRGGTIRFKLRGREVVGRSVKLGASKYTTTAYPRLLPKEEGRTIPEAFGTSVVTRCAVVDTVSKLLRPCLKAQDVGEIQLNGTRYGTKNVDWSYDAATTHVTIKQIPAGMTWANIQNGEWTAFLHGEVFEGNGLLRPGKAARLMLSKMGVPSGDVIKSTFDSLDNGTWVGGWLHWVVEEELPVLEALRLIEASGDFHVAFRPDGKVEAVPEQSTAPDAMTTTVLDVNLEDEVDHGVATTHMGAAMVTEYWGYPSLPLGLAPHAEVLGTSWLARPWWGVDGTRRVETVHATAAGAVLANRKSRFQEPDRLLTLSGDLRTWQVPPGRSIVLSLPEAVDPAGRLDQELCNVRERTYRGGGSARSVVRRARTLKKLERVA